VVGGTLYAVAAVAGTSGLLGLLAALAILLALLFGLIKHYRGSTSNGTETYAKP
jgi:hypothetical protein